MADPTQQREEGNVFSPQRAFIICRQDEPGDHDGVPVAVYVGDNEACRADLEHRQSVNQDCLYYILEKPLNPKSEVVPASRAEQAEAALRRLVTAEDRLRHATRAYNEAFTDVRATNPHLEEHIRAELEVNEALEVARSALSGGEEGDG